MRRANRVDDSPMCILCGNQRVKIRGYFCKGCANDPYLHKRRLKAILYENQTDQCIVAGCPWKSKGITGEGLHMHRIIKGRDGGHYNVDNCVLVCPHHHRRIEGMSRLEISEYICESDHVVKMDLRHTAESIADIGYKPIMDHIINLFDYYCVPVEDEKVLHCVSVLADLDLA